MSFHNSGDRLKHLRSRHLAHLEQNRLIRRNNCAFLSHPLNRYSLVVRIPRRHAVLDEHRLIPEPNQINHSLKHAHVRLNAANHDVLLPAFLQNRADVIRAAAGKRHLLDMLVIAQRVLNRLYRVSQPFRVLLRDDNIKPQRLKTLNQSRGILRQCIVIVNEGVEPLLNVNNKPDCIFSFDSHKFCCNSVNA